MHSRTLKASALGLAFLAQIHLAQAAPQPEKCYGVIELGAKGIKSIVVEDKGKDSQGKIIPPEGLEEIKPQNKNPYDGDTAAVVAEVVLELKGKMIDKYRMPEDHISVVMSSGIPDAVKTKLQGKQFGGTDLQQITAPEESRLVFQGIVPTHRMRLNEVVVLDIGSGNSKGGYLKEGSPAPEFEAFSLPMGTGTFSKEVVKVRQNGEDFKAVADRIAGEQLLGSLQSQIRNKPGMQNCSRLYLAGGLPYVMTTLLHPERIGSVDPENSSRISDWVQLSVEDINLFYKIATTEPQKLQKPDKSKITARDRAAAETELDRVVGIFTQDELTAGAVLLKLFTDNMHAERKEGIFFSRKALYAWPQGYIREKLAKRP